VPTAAARRVLLSVLALAALAIPAATAAPPPPGPHPPGPAPVLDLESLTGQQAEAMMAAGKLTSVQLVRAYLDRIDALNKRGPGLNAVTQLNPDAIREAAESDQRRAAGRLLGPADGLPILMKDLIDVKGMYTSAGNYSLRNSFPATDAGITENLRAHGVVILGKLGLSEFANSFGSQPSGFGNLTGQVLNAIDADQNPSGSSSGTGAAMAAALATLGIGTETSGSIISPSSTQGIVGLRPTVGLVPGDGIAPIDVSQDTAGPMARTVSDVAMTLQSIAGPVSDDTEYADLFGPDYYSTGVIPRPPNPIPDYMSALDPNFVRGKRIGYNGTLTPGSALATAYDALVAAGAVMVPDPATTVGTLLPLPSGYEQHATIDEYYRRLGPAAPIKSLVQEVADNQANAQQALKFGNSNHLSESLADITPGGANETQFRTNIVERKAAYHKAIDDMMTLGTADPSDDVIGVLGSVPSGPQAGYPQITIPMGYNATTRRTVNVSVNGGAYDERNLIGIAYVIEQATHLRQPASMVDPSMYRCADTVPPEPFASRGHCNPDYDAVLKMLGPAGPTFLPFSLETESATSLEARMAAGTLTSEQLVRAYLTRIALTNAEGPAIQAVRDLNDHALEDAKKADRDRAHGADGPLLGLPVLLDDSIDVKGMPTTGGSIALEDSTPRDDSTIAADLKAAGAIVLGKTNVTELDGFFDANIPEGYSSLGGQVLVPSDTDKTPAGSSAGSAAATASGLAALTVGMETSPDGAQLIAPAGVNGVVGLKPTVGLVSRAGVMPVARSQDSPGPIGRTVTDVATALNAIAGPDPDDPATAGAPKPPDYTAGLSANALQGRRIAVISSTTAPYPAVVSALQGAGATTSVVTIGTPSPSPPSIVPTEFKRDLDAYLGGIPGPGAKSLQGILDYDNANPVEGLKYQQGELLAAEAVDLSDPATASAYQTDLTTGRDATRALIDGILDNGTPDDPSDDFDAIVVPNGNALVGYADRAGYPVLTVPAGYGATNSSSGHDPVGVSLVGTAWSEATLLDDGYALEQATNVRLAPSSTNPSMWRCVHGSTFFTAELCNPGDRELEPGTVLANLEATIGGMGLDGGFANDLDHHLDDLQRKLLAPQPDACGGLDDLLQRLLDEAGQERPRLTLAQAESLVATLNDVEGSLGCNDDDALVPKAQAEQDVLALVGTVDGMPLDKALANDLRNTVRDAGKQLVHQPVANACRALADLGKKIADRTGKKNGLAAAQAATLEAARAALATELGC
jgi:Asp-tRNA(Asn)/Glu-tRNA(Gln) amidotransferase A subunit family amidase